MRHAQRCFLDAGHQKLFLRRAMHLRWHIERAHYQAMIWKQAHVPHPTIPFQRTRIGLG